MHRRPTDKFQIGLVLGMLLSFLLTLIAVSGVWYGKLEDERHQNRSDMITACAEAGNQWINGNCLNLRRWS